MEEYSNASFKMAKTLSDFLSFAFNNTDTLNKNILQKYILPRLRNYLRYIVFRVTVYSYVCCIITYYVHIVSIQ